MNLLEFKDRLNKFYSSGPFQLADENIQQSLIKEEIDFFIKDNPDLYDQAFSLAENTYKDYRNNTGQGRYIPSGPVEGPWSKPDFINLSEESKLQSIRDFRSSISSLASQDRLNQDDLEYYYNTVADVYERQTKGEDTGWIADKGYRAWDGLAGFLADAVGAPDTADRIRRFSRENPKYDEDLTAMLAEGAGSIGASMAIFIGGTLAGGAAGPGGAAAGGITASLAANASVRYQEGYRSAVAQGLSDDQATDAGIAAMPAAAIDVLSDKIMGAATFNRGISTALRSGSTTEKIRAIQQIAKDQGARGVLLRASRDAFAEGASEAVGDYVAGYGSYLATGQEEFLPTGQEMSQSFLVGAILGGGISLGGAVPGKIRGDQSTLNDINQEANRIVENRLSETEEAQQAFQLIGQGKYKDALDALNKIQVSSIDTEADVNLTEDQNTGEQNFQSFAPTNEVEESFIPTKGIDNSSLPSLPFINEEEKSSIEKLKLIPESNRAEFEQAVKEQFSLISSDLNDLRSSLNQQPYSETSSPVGGIRSGVLESGNELPTIAEGFAVDETQRITNIQLTQDQGDADFTVLERSQPTGNLSVQPSPGLQTKIQEAVALGRANDIVSIWPVNEQDSSWIQAQNIPSISIDPEIVETDVEGININYAYGNEEIVDSIVSNLDQQYGQNQWIVKDSQGAAGEGIYRSREDLVTQLNTEDGLVLNGLYAEPLNPNIALENRPQGRDYRVHVVKRQGKMEVIPFATHSRFNSLPYLARTTGVTSLENTALEAANRAADQVSENGLLGIDVVLGADGQYVVTELNPTQYGRTAQEYNSLGASGYVRTPYVASAIYSHLKGRVPAWALAGRVILRDELAKQARSQGAPTIAVEISRIIGNVRDAAQLKQELLKTYGEKFADASERIWNAFKESAGQVTQKIVDIIQSIIDSIRPILPKYTATKINSGVMDSANQLVETTYSSAKKKTIQNRQSPAFNAVTRSPLSRALVLDGNPITNAGQLLRYLNVNNPENTLQSIISSNLALQSYLSRLPVSMWKSSGYFGTGITIDPFSENLNRTIEHELFHAISEWGLQTNSEFFNSVQGIINNVRLGPEHQSVQEIVDYVKNVYGAIADRSADLSQLFRINLNSIQNRFSNATTQQLEFAYALLSPAEFISGLADSNFRTLLQRSTPQQEQSIWQRIIDAFVSLFRNISPSTSLDQITSLVSQVVNNPQYQPKISPIRAMSRGEFSRQRIKKTLNNLHRIKTKNFNDRYDANTIRVINATRNLNASEIKKLDQQDQIRVYDLIDNIYNSRSIKTNDPAIRDDTEIVITELQDYARHLDARYIQDKIKDLDGVLDLSGYPSDQESMMDRDKFNAYVDNIKKTNDNYEQLTKDRTSAAKARYEKQQQKFRAKYRQMQSIASDVWESAEDYVNSIEEDHPINSSSLKEFLKVHFDYHTQLADVDNMEGKELYSHFFALNNLLDGRWINGTETTVQYIKNLRDSQVDVESLSKMFRDPQIRNGRGFWGAVDRANQATEIAQVRLERWSAFIKGKDFLEKDLAGGFLKTLLIDSRNAYEKALKDYTERRTEILNGRDFTGEDTIVMAITSRLVQFNAGSDPNQSFLKNVENERKNISNIIGDPNNVDPEKRQGKGDDSQRDEYIKIASILDRILGDIETIENPMQVFMDSLDMRMGLGNLELGAQRREMLNEMQSIQDRFSKDNEIISELFYNKPFERVVHYIPRATSPIHPNQNNTRNLDLKNPIESFDESNYQSNSTTALPFQLETRTGIGDSSHYINNIEHTFEKGLRIASITAHTTAERFILAERLKKNSKISNMINGSNTTYRVEQLKLWASTLLMNAMQSSTPLGKFGEVTKEFTGLYSRVALSGLHHMVSQTTSAYMDYFARYGNFVGGMRAGSFYIQNKKRMDDWFSEHAERILHRSYSGEQELDRRRRVNLDQTALENLPSVKKLKKVFDKAGDIITFSLRKGDDFSIRSLVLAEYHRLVKQKNPAIETIYDVDWTTVEGDLLSQSIINIERSVNASDKVTRGDFFVDREGKTMLIRQTLFAFQQQVMQLAAQFNLAIRDLYDLHQQGGSNSDKARALRTIGAILSQTVTFVASRYVINGLLATAIIAQIRDMFDDEDGKIAQLSMELEQARFFGDDEMVAMAEHELNSARNIRKTIEKFSNQQMSWESFFKNSLKDSLGTMHFAFNGPAIPQKMIFNIVDTFGEQMARETKEKQVSEYKAAIRSAKEQGDYALSSKLEEELTLIESQEWLPFEFDQARNIGMGGVLGAALGGTYATIDEFARYGAGLTEVNWNDFILAAQSAGLGQADLNRMFRVIDKIEDEEFRKTKTFQEKTLPAARQREAEQEARRAERELERVIQEILNS